jgi:hypothetical protein
MKSAGPGWSTTAEPERVWQRLLNRAYWSQTDWSPGGSWVWKMRNKNCLLNLYKLHKAQSGPGPGHQRSSLTSIRYR